MINSRRHTTRCSAFECAIKYFIDIHLTDAKLTLEQPDKKLYKTCINLIAATSRSGTQAQLERCGIKRKIEQCKHCSTYHCSTKRTEHRQETRSNQQHSSGWSSGEGTPSVTAENDSADLFQHDCTHTPANIN